MNAFAKRIAARTSDALRLGRFCAVLLFCLCSIPRAQAAATLLLGEPYSYDGAFAGTGHAAVYLSHVCATSPVVLRPCAEGESGVVLSRYDGIAGYDWVAIPLIPYLYAVDQQEAVPLFADVKIVAFLRDQYRRKYLESLAPDRPDGEMPTGNWYELVGASYDRTIYGFAIETSPEQDALLIRKFNSQPNRERYNFVRRNCADFGREVINFYYPHAVHRSLIADLGVTTPKQIAKMLAKYSRHHLELQTSHFLIPQVSGTIRRSTPVHGALESVVTAKKYMLPLFLLHPYVAGSLLAGYVGRGRFDPARNALVLDSGHQLGTAVTRAERRSYRNRLEELSRTDAGIDAAIEGKDWEHFQARAEPMLDSSGNPVMQVGVGGGSLRIGISRANLLSSVESPELAAGLLQARLRQELRSSTARKTAHTDVENDLMLLQQLVETQRREFSGTLSSANENQVQTGSQ